MSRQWWYYYASWSYRRLLVSFLMDCRGFDVGGAIGVSWSKYSGPFSVHISLGPFWMLCMIRPLPAEPLPAELLPVEEEKI